MTDEQMEQCSRDFGVKMKVLKKNGLFDIRYLKKNVQTPIRIVYAGGIYLNRWKTLAALVDAMRKINAAGIKMVLDVYTNNPLDEQMEKCLNDSSTSVFTKQFLWRN